MFYVVLQNTLLTSPAVAGEYSAGYGVAAFHGDLSKDQSAPVASFQMRFFSHFQNEETRSAPGFAGFEVVLANTVHNGHFFPYRDNAHLSLLGFFMTPGICVDTVPILNICASIGIGTLNLNSKNNRQDYGTWNYQLDGSIQITNATFFRLALKKIGDVEQTVEDRASHFWLTAVLATVGVKIGSH